MTAFFCSRSACGSRRVPCSSTDDRIWRSWMRVSPDVSCARRSTGSSDRACEPLGIANGLQKLQPLGFVGPLDFDLDRLRRADDARADVGEILGDEHEGDVGREERRIGGPFLDEHAHGAVFCARFAGRLGNQRLGVRET